MYYYCMDVLFLKSVNKLNLNLKVAGGHAHTRSSRGKSLPFPPSPPPRALSDSPVLLFDHTQ